MWVLRNEAKCRRLADLKKQTQGTAGKCASQETWRFSRFGRDLRFEELRSQFELRVGVE
jgi:predicted ATP-binding protein involved in virulence